MVFSLPPRLFTEQQDFSINMKIKQQKERSFEIHDMSHIHSFRDACS